MKQGDIRARLLLSTTDFRKNLNAALKDANTTAEAMRKAFAEPLKLPPIPPIPTLPGGSGPKTDPALKEQREAARQGTAAFKDYQLAVRRGNLSQEEFIQVSKALQAQLEYERAQLEKTTRGYALYTTALRAVDNGLSGSFDTRSITSNLDNVSNALDRLQQVGAVVLSGGFLAGLFRGLDRNAQASFQAKTALSLYRAELQDAGRDIEVEVGQLDKLANRFKVTTESLSRFGLILTRQGYTSEQSAGLIEAVGASALNAGRKLDEAFGVAADAFARSDSTLLNGLGVLTNFDDALQKHARTQGVTAESLDRASRNQAIYASFLAETRQEVKALDVLLSGYAGSTVSLDNAQKSLGKTVGSVVTPPLALLKDSLTLLINSFNALPPVLQGVAIGSGVLAAAAAGLGVSYVALRALLLNQATLGPVISDLLRNETVLRSQLGGVILAQARAYDLLNKEQLATLTTARASSTASTAASAAAATGLGRLKALLTTPIKGGFLIGVISTLTILRESSKYVNVLIPTLDAISKSLTGLPFQQTTAKIKDFLAGGAAIPALFGKAVLYSLTAVSITLEELNFQYERSMLVAQKWGQQLRLDAEGAASTQAEIDALGVAHENNKNKILDAAAAYDKSIESTYLAAAGLNTYSQALNSTADAATNAKNALAALSEEDRKIFDDLKGRTGKLSTSLTFELNNGDLQRQVQGATSEIDTLVSEIQAKSATLQDNGPLRYLLTGLELDLRKLRGAAVADVYAQAVQDAQDAATQSQIAALEDGAAKINATYYERIEQERRAFKVLTEGLDKDSQTYKHLLLAFNNNVAGITAQGNRDLQADAQQRLQTAQRLRDQLADVSADTSRQQAEASGNPLQVLKATFQEASRQIQQETTRLLADSKKAYQEGAISYQEYEAQITQIGQDSATKQALNRQKFSKDTETELQRRRDVVARIEGEITAIRAQSDAERLRARGDEVGALETELAMELSTIKNQKQPQRGAEGRRANPSAGQRPSQKGAG